MSFRPLAEALEERTLLSAGSLDPTFGSAGTVVSSFPGAVAAGNAVAIQSDGKIIVVGSATIGANSEFAVARYNTNGTLDTTFGTNGEVTTSFSAGSSVANAVALDSSGNIVVVGTAGQDFALARYTSGGVLDTSFNGTGQVATNFQLLGLSVLGGDSAYAVAIQSNGAIVVAGTGLDLLGILGSDFVVARYTSTGGLDSSFGSGGLTETSFGLLQTDGANAVAIQSNGAIVVGGHTSTGTGSDFALARYTTGGALDTSFNGSGKVTTNLGTSDDVHALAIQSNGAIVAVGTTTQGTIQETGVVRYKTNGALDTTFNGTGKVIQHLGNASEGNAVAVQSDGNIVVAGQENAGSGFTFVLERYLGTNGSLDTTFGTSGVITTDVGAGADGANGLLIQPDGKLVAAGYSGNNFAAARYFGSSASADLAVTDVVDNATPNVGATIHYTITVTNNGPSSSSELQLTDLAPAGVTFISGSGTGSFNTTTGIWNIGNLSINGTATLTITALVTGTGGQTIVNTASVTSMGEFDPDLTNNFKSATIVVANPADLGLTNVVNNSNPIAGATVTFTITLTNGGPGGATNVSVTDSVPAGLAYLSFSATQGSYNSSTGVWTVGSLANGASVILQIQAKVTGSSPTTDTATITAEDQIDPNTSNNSRSATVTPQVTDVAVTKTVDNASPLVGSTVTFTITVTDKGPLAASNIALSDLLPAGLSFVSASASQGGYSNATGVWTVGGLTGTGATATLTVVATVNTSSPVTNTASITALDQYDSNSGNDSDSVTVTPVVPAVADLSVTNTVDNATPNVGNTVTFTITVTNNGPNTATGVLLSDPLPAGLGFSSSNQLSYDSATGVWNIGTLASGASITLTLAAVVNQSGLQTDTASITALNQTDPDLSNNSASVTISAPSASSADLGLTLSVDNATPGPGATIVFLLTLTNNGPSATTGVTVTDLLPSGLTFISSNASQGSYDGTTGVWTVGTVNVGAANQQTLTITATVTSATPKTDMAVVSGSSETDPVLSNNMRSVLVTPLVADLGVTTNVSSTSPTVGGTVTITITVQNFGPDQGTGVQVTDLLPAGLTYVSSTSTQGSYNSSTGVWTVGTVNVGAANAQTLTITATVGSQTPSTNTAFISGSLEFDSNPANNDPGIVITPVLPVVPPVTPSSPAGPTSAAPSKTITAAPVDPVAPAPDLLPTVVSTNVIPISFLGGTIPGASVIQVIGPDTALEIILVLEANGAGDRGTEDAEFLVLLEEDHDLSMDDEVERLKVVSHVFMDEAFALRLTNRANSSGTIIGYCFEDVDGNGIQNGDETPLEGFKVYLDVEHKEQLDQRTPTAVTDKEGHFRFEGLAPGVYVVRPAPTRHYKVTSPEEGVARVLITSEKGARVTFGCRPVRARRPSSGRAAVPVPERVAPLREENVEARDAFFSGGPAAEPADESAPSWLAACAAAAVIGVPMRLRQKEQEVVRQM